MNLLLDRTSKSTESLPVIAYFPLSGEVGDADLDRYFADLDAIRNFIKIQPVYLIVPDQAQGEFRLHRVDHANASHLFDYLKADFKLCDLLSRK